MRKKAASHLDKCEISIVVQLVQDSLCMVGALGANTPYVDAKSARSIKSSNYQPKHLIAS